MDLKSELETKGWHISKEGLEICKEGLDRPNAVGIIQKALDIDLREIGGMFFPEDMSRGKHDFVSGAGVVQIQKIKNASAPKYEYGSGAPAILRLLLTDGNAYVNCLQWGQWKSITMDTPPGTKIYLKPGKIVMQNNFMLLSENQFSVLGGCVAQMVEKWDLCRRLASHVRTKGDLDGSGPPPWIPFGKPINTSKPMKGKNFRSLETDSKEVKEEDEAFKQQRLANIAEVARVKEAKLKVFGGGKDVKQTNVKTESGNFSHILHSNTNDSSNYSRPQKNFNEYENRQSPRKQTDNKFPRSNKNGRTWPAQDMQRIRTPHENSSQGQSYSKDKKLDYRNKFNSNEFQTSRNQVTHQPKPFNNNSYRGNDGSNSSKKFQKTPNFYEDFKSSDKYFRNDKSSDIEDMAHKISQVKLHGYDSRNDDSISIPNKPFLKPGTEVMARYWEDDKFYRAVVHAVGPEGKTCVVNFQEYGNYEEILISDVQQIKLAPTRSANWNIGPFSFQPSHWDNREPGQEFRSSEDYQDSSHRYSGQGRSDRQKTQRQDFRPSAKLYQPPQQRQIS